MEPAVPSFLEQDWNFLGSQLQELVLWKQNFLRDTDFQSKEDLIAAALLPGDAQLFVRQALALRHNKQRRHSFADFTSGAAGNQKARWFQPFASTVFEMYTLDPSAIPNWGPCL
jgi:hypothetical protein